MFLNQRHSRFTDFKMSFVNLGWSPLHAEAFLAYSHQDLIPARVVLQHRHAYEVLSADGPFNAECTGRLLHFAASASSLPAVGDWVAIRPRLSTGGAAGVQERKADIHAVLPRQSCLSRRAAGDRDEEQVLAANVDTLFLVTGLDQNFNVRRIERYLAVARAGHVEPVILLNKADLHPEPHRVAEELRTLVPGLPVLLLTAREGAGVAELATWLRPGRTVVLLGSSGVGKSTLINQLLGEARQKTGEVSDAVNKGRHTTSHRELIPLASGAVVIDTPGLRELQFWDVDEGAVQDSFADISRLAQHCRFHDCGHQSEPGCAILAALEDGTLAEDRWASYSKLRREQAYAARRVDPVLARRERDRWKKIHQGMRQRERFEREF